MSLLTDDRTQVQQVEDFADGTVSPAYRRFRPVSRYFDRITRLEQIMQLAKGDVKATDPAQGPVTRLVRMFRLSPMLFRIGSLRRASGKCDASAQMRLEMARAIAALRKAKRLLTLPRRCGHSGASAALIDFAESAGIPVAATQAGKSVMPEVHPNYAGSLGVTGSSAANDPRLEAMLFRLLAAACRIY